MVGIITHGFRGKVWSNGQFGLSKCKEISIGSLKVRLDGEASRHWRESVQVYGVLPTLDFIREPGDEFLNTDGCLYSVPHEQASQRRLDPIGLSLRSKRHKRGMLGITTHGQKVVRCAAKLLQEQFGRSRLSFLTLTVPGMTSHNLSLITDDWTRIVKVFVQKLKRSLVGAGLSEEIVGVTEIQERRFDQRGELALHLHLLFQGAKRPWAWEFTPRDYREMWFSVLEGVVPRSEWTSEKGAEEVRAVKHSAEGYLGKYMSKGAKNLFVVRERFPDVSLPSAWWTCTYVLRRKVLRSICYVSHDSAKYLLELIETCPDVFDFLKVVRVRMGERDVGVGFCGRISPDRLVEIRETLYALKEVRIGALGGAV